MKRGGQVAGALEDRHELAMRLTGAHEVELHELGPIRLVAREGYAVRRRGDKVDD